MKCIFDIPTSSARVGRPSNSTHAYYNIAAPDPFKSMNPCPMLGQGVFGAKHYNKIITYALLLLLNTNMVKSDIENC